MGRLQAASYRWDYRREQDVISCELVVVPRQQRYRLTVARDGWSSVDDFAELVTAIQRHVTIERELIATGWSLSDYQRVALSGAAARRRRPPERVNQLPLPALDGEEPVR